MLVDIRVATVNSDGTITYSDFVGAPAPTTTAPTTTAPATTAAPSTATSNPPSTTTSTTTTPPTTTSTTTTSTTTTPTTTTPTTTTVAKSGGGAIGGSASTLITYNWNPAAQLTNARAAYAAVRVGTAGTRMRILCAGDSTTQGVDSAGVGAQAYRSTAAYPAQLAKKLGANYDSFSCGGPGIDPRLTLVGTAQWAGAVGAGGQLVNSQVSGDGVLFTPTVAGVYDHADIMYLDFQVAPTQIVVTFSDRTTQTVNYSTGASGSFNKTTIAFGSPKTVTSVSVVAASNAIFFLESVSLWNSAAPNVEVYNFGTGGQDSSIVNSGQITGYGAFPGFVASNAQLALINYGINDIQYNERTPQASADNLALMARVLKAHGCDPVIVIPHPFLNNFYPTALPALRAALHAYSDSQNFGIVDLSATFSDDPNLFVSSGYMDDNPHPNAAGYAMIGSRIATLLLSSLK